MWLSPVMIPKIQYAMDLVELNARVPIIAYLLPDIDKKLISHLYEQVHGTKSPQGQLPNQQSFYTYSYDRRMQSSVLYKLYDQLIRNGVDETKAMIEAYKQYKTTFEEPLIEFNRFWSMLMLVSTKSMKMVKCNCCSCSYIEDSMEPASSSKCPSCWFGKKLKTTRKLTDSASFHKRNSQNDMPQLGHA